MKEEIFIPFLGETDNVKFYVLDRGYYLAIIAVRNNFFLNDMIISSKPYFYGLLGKRVFDHYLAYQERCDNRKLTEKVDVTETNGPWQEKVFLYEDGLFMIFSQTEQFVMCMSQVNIDSIVSYLQTEGLKPNEYRIDSN